MLALVQHCLDHCQPARSYLLEMPKTGTVLVLLPEINDFFCKINNDARSPFHSVFRKSKHRSFPVNFPRGVTHPPNRLTDNDLTDR